jgi:hypothetical protein
MMELLDAAEACKRLQEIVEVYELAHGAKPPLGWHLSVEYGADLFCSGRSAAYPHPTPQAAVLAALGPKGETDETH